MGEKVKAGDVTFENFNQFRSEGKFCDVTVIIENVRFPCHRMVLAATSGYFNSLFNSTFEDSSAAEILLKDVDSETFECILNYMYMKSIDINWINAYVLLSTSDYLVMDELKERCMEFIERNPEVVDALKICQFASSFPHYSEFAKIVIKNTAKFFFIFINSDDFLNIEFELLDSIMKEKQCPYYLICDTCERPLVKIMRNNKIEGFWYCNPCDEIYNVQLKDDDMLSLKKGFAVKKKNGGILLSKLIEWITYRPVERIQYISQLLKYGGMVEKHGVALQELITKHASQLCPTLRSESLSNPAIRVFAVIAGNLQLVNFLLNASDNCWIQYEQYEEQFNNLKSLEVEKDLYFLSSKVTQDGIINQFWINGISDSNELESPPIISDQYSMACINKLIYLYSANIIHAYTLKSKRWSKIKEIPQILFDSYFVSVDNKLLVVGGSKTCDLDMPNVKEKVLQFFDPGTSTWSEKPLEKDLTLKGAACSSNTQVFICEYIDNKDAGKTRVIHVYDVISDEWETIGMKKEAAEIKKLVYHCNRLWAFPLNPGHRVEIYDLQLKLWSEIVGLPSVVILDGVDYEIAEILDGIVL